ncbi:hypothetical protein F7725_025638 [Dissostichus mawsoni]|uniref:DUF4371 domain-containing protein n=1 Tax=Dissostichus mawsoni TaxID=36200 RepID=A0A7J5XBR3_DISMA|nr:hypothetical protein F7725_025638 [Dissostichus mawsoni]
MVACKEYERGEKVNASLMSTLTKEHTYDGASVMSGKHSGVQARIKEVEKQAFYVHCNAHSLNLVLVDTGLYVFMSGSYVHTR